MLGFHIMIIPCQISVSQWKTSYDASVRQIKAIQKELLHLLCLFPHYISIETQKEKIPILKGENVHYNFLEILP